MARTRSRFACQECGYSSPKWHGRCPGCGAWNTMVEEVLAAGTAEGAGRHRSWTEGGSEPVAIDRVSSTEADRYSTGFPELDRVLGGGLVPGSLVLIGGDPGVGKSTLLLQVMRNVAGAVGPCLYVSGEESARQVQMRAQRLGTLTPELYVAAETDLERIEEFIQRLTPVAVVVDSIQTVFHPGVSSAPGSVSQVRECAAHLLRLAKTKGITILLVGHVTKGGDLAGPRTLEHATDAVLYFEGERYDAYRVIRAAKNRFGSTQELGLFEMGNRGLRQVPDPSHVFLAERPRGATGSVVVASIEGSRPLLMEIQALLVPTPFGHPRRTVSGVDANRAAFILAVLERKVDLNVGPQDVYVKVSGGLRVSEPAADLGMAVAMASSFRNRPVPEGVVVFGEVGLSGEVRAVYRADDRLREAARLGFTRCILPAANARGSTWEKTGKLDVVGVETVARALEVVLD